jgi:hypothetical protein
MKDKDRILLDILSEFVSAPIRVIEVRDKFLLQSEEELDPAATRRWVNGKCVTLARKGLLIRNKNESNKKYYYEHSPEFLAYVDLAIKKHPVSFNKVTTLSSKAKLNNLEGELESCRQAMLSQLGEIEEYRRIRDAYPELGDIATLQFKQAVDDNYRMLGRVRALEKLMKASPC